MTRPRTDDQDLLSESEGWEIRGCSRVEVDAKACDFVVGLLRDRLVPFEDKEALRAPRVRSAPTTVCAR